MRNVARAKDKEFNMRLGVNARYFREQAGLTNKQVAEGVSYSEAWVSNLENSKTKKRISEQDVSRLAEVLGVPVGYLTSYDPTIEDQFSEINELIQMRRYDAVVDQADRLIDITKKEHGPRYQTMALLKRGNIEFYQEQFTKALEYYRSALHIAEIYRDENVCHQSLQNIINAHMQLNEYDPAERMAFAGLEESEGLNHAKYLQLLGRIYVQQEKLEKAEQTLFDAVAQGEAYDAPAAFFMLCYQLLSVVFVNTDGRYTDAIASSEMVLEIAKKINHVMGSVYGLRIQSEALLSINQLESAKNILTIAQDITPKDRITERLENEFLLLCCEAATPKVYFRMKEILDELEKTTIALRSLAKIYIKAAKTAGKLGLIDDIIAHYDRSLQISASIIR